MGTVSGWLVVITVIAFTCIYAFYGDEFFDGDVPEPEFSLTFLSGVLNILTVGVFDPDVELAALTRIVMFLSIHLPWVVAVVT